MNHTVAKMLQAVKVQLTVTISSSMYQRYAETDGTTLISNMKYSATVFK